MVLVGKLLCGQRNQVQRFSLRVLEGNSFQLWKTKMGLNNASFISTISLLHLRRITVLLFWKWYFFLNLCPT